tara:strand:+ start:184 stop:354 length:171 start_codon:yes stop_codon:yes gene_type:complete
MKLNWINGYKANNKKEVYRIELRLGTMTLFYVHYCACVGGSCSRFRLMLFNFGIEI